MIILILNGPAKAGKGTLVDFLKKLYSCRIWKYSSITWAKQIATGGFKWDGEKTPATREMIAEIHQVGIKHGNIPFQKLTAEVKARVRGLGAKDLFITDIREPDNIANFVKWCNEESFMCYTIRIQNDTKEKEAKQTLGKADNIYMNYDYNFIISNNETKEAFEEKIKLLFASILN